MLLETIISSTGGLFAGLVPTALKMFKQHRQHKQELESIRLQAEIQKELGSMRLDEARAAASSAELIAAYQHDTAGIDRAPPWAVAIRILQRPSMAWAVLGLFIGVAAYSLATAIVEPLDIFNRAAHFANFVMVYYFTDRAAGKQFNGEK